MIRKTFVFICGGLLSGSAFADCPTTLPIQELTDCIVAEGADQPYEDYLKETYELEQEIIASSEEKSTAGKESTTVSKMEP